MLWVYIYIAFIVFIAECIRREVWLTINDDDNNRVATCYKSVVGNVFCRWQLRGIFILTVFRLRWPIYSQNQFKRYIVPPAENGVVLCVKVAPNGSWKLHGKVQISTSIKNVHGIFPIRKRVKLKFTFTLSLQIWMTNDVKTIFRDFKQAIGRRRRATNN